jgi:hypothetical protein
VLYKYLRAKFAGFGRKLFDLRIAATFREFFNSFADFGRAFPIVHCPVSSC